MQSKMVVTAMPAGFYGVGKWVKEKRERSKGPSREAQNNAHFDINLLFGSTSSKFLL